MCRKILQKLTGRNKEIESIGTILGQGRILSSINTPDEKMLTKFLKKAILLKPGYSLLFSTEAMKDSPRTRL